MALVGNPISVESAEWLCQRNQGICTGRKAVPSDATASAKIDRLGEIRSCLQSSAPIIAGLVGPQPNALRKPCVPLNSFDLQA